MTRYFTNFESGRTVCDASPSCIGHTLQAAVDAGRKGQKNFRGINGEPFSELTPFEIQMWADGNLQEFGRSFVCDHEMSAALKDKEEVGC